MLGGELTAPLPSQRPEKRIGVGVIEAPRGTLAIFSGCVGDIADPDLAADLAVLLAECCFSATTPAAQTCCGEIGRASCRERVSSPV